MLVVLFPPFKGGMTTFLLHFMNSYLNQRYDFIPFTTTRPPKKKVIDDVGYRAVLRAGP